MIFKLIKKSLNYVMDNPSVTLYFVLFLILINVLAFYALQASVLASKIAFSLATISLAFAFSSGWFQVILETDTKEKNLEKNFFNIFLEGVGKNIIPVSLGSILYGFIFICAIALTSLVANAVFGNLDFVLKDMMSLAQTSINPSEFLAKLNDNQKYILYAWQLSFLFVAGLFNFIFLYYFPALFKKDDKNKFIKPFVAIFDSVCFLFRNFWISLLLFIVIFVLYIAIELIKPFIANNTILMVLHLFVSIYFIASVVMLIFKYYEQENLYNNRGDSIGQNENVDSIGTED